MAWARSKVFEAYKALKTQYASKEDSFEWWYRNSGRPELGIVSIDERTKKARFRHEDDTPSVAFYQNLSYVDFGGDGQKKDPVDRIVENTGLSRVEAAKLVLEWEGVSEESYTPVNNYIPKERKREYKKPYNNDFIRQNMARGKSKEHKKVFWKLLKGLIRSGTNEEIVEAVRLLRIGFLEGKDEYSPRLFIPEFDDREIAWGHYLYNREANPKGLLRKNSKRTLFPGHLVKRYGDTILFAEGHTDVANMVAKKIPAITTGGATTNIPEEYMHMLYGKKVLFFPDLDLAGMVGVTKKLLQIVEANKSLEDGKKISFEVFWWAPWSKKTKKLPDEIRHLKGGVIKDPSDGGFLVHKKAFEAIQRLKFDNLPESCQMSQWKMVFKNKKEVKKWGYDFTDYLLEGGVVKTRF